MISRTSYNRLDVALPEALVVERVTPPGVILRGQTKTAKSSRNDNILGTPENTRHERRSAYCISREKFRGRTDPTPDFRLFLATCSWL